MKTFSQVVLSRIVALDSFPNPIAKYQAFLWLRSSNLFTYTENLAPVQLNDGGRYPPDK